MHIGVKELSARICSKRSAQAKLGMYLLVSSLTAASLNGIFEQPAASLVIRGKHLLEFLGQIEN
jgi:hypothetical protein